MRLFSFVLALIGAAGLLLTTGCNQSEQYQSQIDSLETANQQLQREVSTLRDTLRERSQSTDNEGTMLTPAVFFPSGSAWLTDRAKDILDDHAATIKQRYENRDFRIKGYTDDVPIGDSLKTIYPDNWYLSAQRAAAVAHYLDAEHQIRTRTLEIGAYGPQGAIASNNTAQGRRQNRRVEIVIDQP